MTTLGFAVYIYLIIPWLYCIAHNPFIDTYCSYIEQQRHPRKYIQLYICVYERGWKNCRITIDIVYIFHVTNENIFQKGKMYVISKLNEVHVRSLNELHLSLRLYFLHSGHNYNIYCTVRYNTVKLHINFFNHYRAIFLAGFISCYNLRCHRIQLIVGRNRNLMYCTFKTNIREKVYNPVRYLCLASRALLLRLWQILLKSYTVKKAFLI